MKLWLYHTRHNILISITKTLYVTDVILNLFWNWTFFISEFTWIKLESQKIAIIYKMFWENRSKVKATGPVNKSEWKVKEIN